MNELSKKRVGRKGLDSKILRVGALKHKIPAIDKKEFLDGVKDGFPIGLGYFAVAFSLGIAARNAGLTVFQGFLTSLLCNASAGEYAFFSQIAAGASLIEIAALTLVINARYLLMSCAMSQKLEHGAPLRHRLVLGFDITDELFGIEIARSGCLSPWYAYGAMLSSAPFWAAGTALGIAVGNILPVRIVSALSVALFGMFLAVIIPPIRTNKVIGGCVIAGFAASYLANVLPYLAKLSSGTKTIILTIVISALAGWLFPIEEKSNE